MSLTVASSSAAAAARIHLFLGNDPQLLDKGHRHVAGEVLGGRGLRAAAPQQRGRCGAQHRGRDAVRGRRPRHASDQMDGCPCEAPVHELGRVVVASCLAGGTVYGRRAHQQAAKCGNSAASRVRPRNTALCRVVAPLQQRTAMSGSRGPPRARAGELGHCKSSPASIARSRAGPGARASNFR